MEILRTPEECFYNLLDFDFAPQYVEIAGLRIHYVDEGPRVAAPVLMLHGEPSWSYLYRKMIPIITAAGHRAVAPDLAGFGRSDKPARREDYTYQFHVDLMTGLIKSLDLREITLVGQDWGGLIGLRIAAEHPDRFARIVVANTGLPTGDQPMTEGFLRWREYSQTVENFHVGGIIKGGCVNDPRQPHVTIAGAGHFLQEDKGAELAQIIADFINRTEQ
jgi:haloalkane dehalogenase